MMDKRLSELKEQLMTCAEGIKAVDSLLQSRQLEPEYIEWLLRNRNLFLENIEKTTAEIHKIAEMCKIKNKPSMLDLADYIDQKLAES